MFGGNLYPKPEFSSLKGVRYQDYQGMGEGGWEGERQNNIEDLRPESKFLRKLYINKELKKFKTLSKINMKNTIKKASKKVTELVV